MNKLFNIVNIGYSINSLFVKVPFKKKYIYILEKLLKINCIASYNIKKDYIIITLRYYKNKPLFNFLIVSSGGNKVYKKCIIKDKNNLKFSNSTLSLFFTSYGLLTQEEIFYKNTGGEHLVDIVFLNTN